MNILDRMKEIDNLTIAELKAIIAKLEEKSNQEIDLHEQSILLHYSNTVLDLKNLRLKELW
jgi:hypothetical protein